METTPKDPKPDGSTPEDGESYEDSWYQVLKRRAEGKPGDPPADDQKTDQRSDQKTED